MREYFINLSEGSQLIANAIDAGLISDDIDISQEGDIIRENSNPRWRMGATGTWRHNSGLGAGARFDYTGNFVDTSVTGEYVIPHWSTINLYAQYEYDRGGAFNGPRLLVGVNNLFDKEPQLADETNGYFSDYYSARRRFLYFEARKEFN